MKKQICLGGARRLNAAGLRWLSGIAGALLIAGSPVLADPPPLEAYGRLPAVDMVTLSPSGERFAFETTVNGTRRVVARAMDGQILAAASVDSVKLRGIRWAGEDFVVLSVSETVNLGWQLGFNHELYQKVALDLNTGAVRSLLANRRFLNASFGEYGYARRGEDWFGYFAAFATEASTAARTARVLGDLHLLEVNLRNGGLRTLQRVSHGGGWLMDAEGEVLANARYDDRRGIWRLYSGNRQRTAIAEGVDPRRRYRILGQGRRPGSILYQTVDVNDAASLMEILPDVDDAPVHVLASEQPHRMLFDRQTGTLSGFVRESDQREWSLFDETRQSRIDAATRAFTGLNVQVHSVDDAFRHVVLMTDGYRSGSDEGDPGTWWLVDTEARRADILGDARPDIPSEWVAPVRMVEYEAADGLTMHGVLTLPPHLDHEALPVIALPHGGPEARDYPGFDWMAQAFASRGYAVWQPNFRGSSGYGAEFRNAGHGEWGGKMQTDISDGIAALAEMGIVDADRACIVGASYGGYAALAGVTLQQGVYRCAVSIAGVTDLRRMMNEVRHWSSMGAERYFRQFMGGDHSLFNRALDARSPARLAERADAPVLLIHGKDDVVVPIEQSRVMAAALRGVDKSVQFVELDGEDHYLSREPTRQQALVAAVDFVQRHLPAGEMASEAP